MADLIGGLHLVHTEPLRLSNDETGTNDVEFTVSAAGVLSVTPMSGEKVVFGYDVEVGDDLVIDDTLTVTGVSLFTGSAGFGTAALAAVRVLLAAGSASLAPMRLTSGTVLTSPVAGSVEFLTDDYFVTISTGTARKGVVLDNGSRLTSGSIPVATTNGRLADGPAYSAGVLTLSGNLLFNATNTYDIGVLNAAGVVAATSPRNLYLTGSMVVGTRAQVPSPLPALHLVQPAAAQALRFDAYTDTAPFGQFRANGSPTAITKSLTTNVLGGFAAFSHTGAAFAGGPSARILITATQDGDVGRGAYMQFGTAPNGGNVTARWRLTEDGHWWAEANNIYDIGQPTGPSSVPRNVYVGTSLIVNAAGGASTFNTGKLSLDGLLASRNYLAISATDTVGVYASNALVASFTNGTHTFSADLVFPDATYDIGKPSLTRPRDLSISRNALVGGTLGVVGVTTLATSLTGILRADSGVVSVSAGVGARSIFDHFADVANGTTVETDLYSDTLAAGRLAANGEKVTAQYGIVLAGAVSSTQQVRVYFGGTLVFDTGALNIGAATTDYLNVRVMAIRVSSSVVRVFVDSTSNIAALGADAAYTEVTGLTLSSTQVLKITGTAAGIGGASNQITAKEGYVEWLPAAA